MLDTKLGACVAGLCCLLVLSSCSSAGGGAATTGATGTTVQASGAGERTTAASIHRAATSVAGDSSGSSTRARTSPAADASASSPHHPSVTTANTPAAAARVPQLAPQLVSLRDLPAGWSVPSSSSGSVREPDCFTAAQRTSGAAADQSATFAKSQLPVLIENLGYYPGSSAASNFTAAAAALSSCKQVTFSAGGATLTGTVQAMSFPTLGDESRAYDVTLSGYGFTLSIQIVLARKGHELLVVAYADQGAPDRGSFGRFANVAFGKLIVT